MTPSEDNQSHLLTLCGKVRDGDITAEELAELEAWLLSDSAAMQTYLRFMSLCSGLEQIADLRQSSRKRKQLAEELEAALEARNVPEALTPSSPYDDDLPAYTDVAPVTLPRRKRSKADRSRRNIRIVIAAVASTAALALVTFLGLHWNSANDRAFAQVESVQQPVWVGENTLEAGSAAIAREYSLASGGVQLQYENGAELVVQAPARFTLVDSRRLTLSSGVVALHIPDQATGFRVDTPYGSAIDHGTRIGVVADAENGLELHVFEGKAELVAPETANRRMLTANEAARLEIDTTEIARIDPEPEYFAKTLSESTALPRVAGDIELRIRPPRSVRRVRADLIDRGRATVFAERIGVELQEDIEVTMTPSGSADTVDGNNETLAAGTTVDSFFVHFVLPRDLWRSSDVLTAEGRITFDCPIAAVISDYPAKTRDTLGHPATDYPGDRDTGLELNTSDDPQLTDQISITAGRQTLTFRLHLVGRSDADQQDRVDQFRVLTESNH